MIKHPARQGNYSVLTNGEAIQEGVNREAAYEYYHSIISVFDKAYQGLNVPLMRVELQQDGRQILFTLYSRETGFITDTMNEYFGIDEERT